VVTFTLGFPTKFCMHFSFPNASFFSHPYHLPYNIWSRVEIAKLLSFLFSPFSVCSSFLGPIILLSIVFPNTLNLEIKFQTLIQ